MIGIGMKEGKDDSPQVLRMDQQDHGARGRENVEIQDLTPEDTRLRIAHRGYAAMDTTTVLLLSLAALILLSLAYLAYITRKPIE